MAGAAWKPPPPCATDRGRGYPRHQTLRPCCRAQSSWRSSAPWAWCAARGPAPPRSRTEPARLSARAACDRLRVHRLQHQLDVEFLRRIVERAQRPHQSRQHPGLAGTAAPARCRPAVPPGRRLRRRRPAAAAPAPAARQRRATGPPPGTAGSVPRTAPPRRQSCSTSAEPASSARQDRRCQPLPAREAALGRVVAASRCASPSAAASTACVPKSRSATPRSTSGVVSATLTPSRTSWRCTRVQIPRPPRQPIQHQPRLAVASQRRASAGCRQRARACRRSATSGGLRWPQPHGMFKPRADRPAGPRPGPWRGRSPVSRTNADAISTACAVTPERPARGRRPRGWCQPTARHQRGSHTRRRSAPTADHRGPLGTSLARGSGESAPTLRWAHCGSASAANSAAPRCPPACAPRPPRHARR